MAEEFHNPHDKLVHAVLGDVAAATSFLQAHLPQALCEVLNWSTLQRLDASFVDEALRGSEADLLYDIELISGTDSVWLYLLVEHQSSVEPWMRLRLLKYCCRIWEMNLSETKPGELRSIVPVVFYQGERGWSPSTEFADLFAASVRDWPWVPHFTHELIDQSGLQVDEVQGDVRVRIMQLLMLAAYHQAEGWMEQVAVLWEELTKVTPRGGLNYLQIFVLYVLSTQEPEAAAAFGRVLGRHGAGDDVMTYAQQLLAEGEAMGKMRNQVEMIENFLREGVNWDVIERATGLNEAQFDVLKQQVEDMTT